MGIKNNRYFLLASAQLFPLNEVNVIDQPSDDEALLLAKKAFKSFREGDFQAALSLYTAGITRFPEQAFFHAARSILNAQLHDPEGAFYDYQVAKGIDFNYHIFLEWYVNKPDMPVAEPAVGFSDLQSLLETALDATQQFDYEHALKLYTQAVSAFSESADVLVYRGALHMRLLRYDLALSDFQTAIVLEPAHFQAHLSLAKLYQAIHAFDLALDAFDKAALLSPDSSVIYEERGNFHIEQHAYTEALADLNRLVMLLPDDFYVYAIRGDLHGRMEAWESALLDYSKAIQLNPYYSDLYSYRAEVKEKMGDLDGAAADRHLFEQIEADE